MASRLVRKLGGAFLFEDMVGLVTLRCKLLKLKGTKRKGEIPNPIPRVNQQKVAENGPAGAEGGQGGEGETAEDGNGEIAKGKSRGRGGGGKGAGRGRGKGGRPPAAAANAAEGELKAKLLSKLMGNTS